MTGRSKGPPQSRPPGREPVDGADGDSAVGAALDAGELAGYDPALPSRAKGLWLAGDWETLAQIRADALREAPARGELLMLVASAFSNLDRPDEARALACKAMDWGCPKRFAALVLAAGVHNTLGRIAALRDDQAALERHFQASVNATARKRDTLPVQVRSIREMSRLGLLPQAAKALEKNAWALDKEPDPSERGEKLKTLKLEADLLKQQVLLAVRNGQVFGAGPGAEAAETVDPKSMSEAELKTLSTSQLGQDLWALKVSGFKTGGFFVEFGATDGVLFSNTYMLERHFGWDGLLAEPNPAFLKSLHKNRSAIATDACIHGETGLEADFVFADVYGGLRDFSERDSHSDRRKAYAASEDNVVRVKTISLDEFLERYDAPQEIDFISVDTEGNELEIVKAFPFEKWKVRCWTIEHNFTKEREEIESIMRRNGYRRIEAAHDDWYVLE